MLLCPVNADTVYLVDANATRTHYLILRKGVQLRLNINSNLIYKETHRLHLYYSRTKQPSITHCRTVVIDDYISGNIISDHDSAIQKFL